MTKNQLQQLAHSLVTYADAIKDLEPTTEEMDRAVNLALLEAKSSWPGPPAVLRSGFTQVHFETVRDICEIEEAAARTDLTDEQYRVVGERLKVDGVLRLLHAGIGLATEGGELLDALKKYLFYGKPLDIVNAIEELGDVSWYTRIGAKACDSSLLEAMLINVRKLRKRYPEKFTEQEANNRDLDAERKVLEGQE